jgi:hypothetical protein
MVMGVSSGFQSAQISSPSTSIPNLFVVSDTVTPSPDLASVTNAAASLAKNL